jgi:uncharacterized protein (TIGR00255 family)
LLANEDLLFVPSGSSLPAAFQRKSGEFVFKKTYAWRTTGGGEVGHRLDFLAQELSREINTIGAKSQLAVITGLVVECKDELSRIREQLANVI